MTEAATLKAAAIALLLAGAAALGLGGATAQSGLNIPFALDEDTSLKDPDNPTKTFRIDMARVEQEHPLSRADLMKITPENLAALSQERVDQVYGRITAGPIPDGMYLGQLFFPQGNVRARLAEIIGGLEGRAVGRGIDALERIGGELWKGKFFQRDRRILHNMIDPPLLLGELIGLLGTVDRSNTIPERTLPPDNPLRRLFPERVSLLFPAKIHCGQSLMDARRESIVIDYAYSDEITSLSAQVDDGFRKGPDSLAGRGGLRIRDEIRMVRPGLYLGRAYANRMFLLNFTLFSADVANSQGPAFAAGGPVAEECWPGEQRRAGR